MRQYEAVLRDNGLAALESPRILPSPLTSKLLLSKSKQ